MNLSRQQLESLAEMRREIASMERLAKWSAEFYGGGPFFATEALALGEIFLLSCFCTHDA